MEKRTIDIGKRLGMRLVEFGVLIMDMAEDLPNTLSGRHLSGQLVRSGTSPVLNYGEARGAESDKDFVHKLNLVLKELRETHANLELIFHANMLSSNGNLVKAINECNELIAIFTSSVKTVKKRM